MLEKLIYVQRFMACAALLLLGSVWAETPHLEATNATEGAVAFRDCPNCPEMVMVPEGKFIMGSSKAEQTLAHAAGSQRKETDRETPQHRVRVRSFAVGRDAVTKAEFAAFVQAENYRTDAEKGDGCVIVKDNTATMVKTAHWRDAGFDQTDDHPVVCVSWNDAQAYIHWISQLTGKRYRLPSESEREYATRAGSQTAFWWGDNITTLQANYAGYFKYNDSPRGEVRQATVPVQSFGANPFGLYNVHGNVFEWVQDCFHANYHKAPTDGSAWTSRCSEDRRVLRGGSWSNQPSYLRSAFRIRGNLFFRNNVSGFRVAQTL